MILSSFVILHVCLSFKYISFETFSKFNLFDNKKSVTHEPCLSRILTKTVYQKICVDKCLYSSVLISRKGRMYVASCVKYTSLNDLNHCLFVTKGESMCVKNT